MNKDKILAELNLVEEKYNIKLPTKYKKFLAEEVVNIDAYEIRNSQGDTIYFYNYKDIIERNRTYDIQKFEPNYLLIGQSGDLGYFVSVKDSSDQIYSLDLGALGSLDMDKEVDDIYTLNFP